MITFKQKIELLKNLKTDTIDMSNIDKYIEFMNYKTITKPILQKVIYTLIDLDVYISSIYDSISEEDWNDIITAYDTPIDNPLYGLIREKIQIFLVIYEKTDNYIKNIKTGVLLDCFSKIPFNKTSTTQFLFFRLGLIRPKAVLLYFFENVKIKPIVYIPFFTSFIARCDIPNFEVICEYIDYVKQLKKGTSLNYVLATQGLLYICCFKREIFFKCVEIIDYVFKNDVYKLMNSFLVETFCELFEYKFKSFKSLENFALYNFPFDKSIFPKIRNLYKDKYIEFKK